jgi:anti-anti-sigma factor
MVPADVTARGRFAVDRRNGVACMSIDGEIDLANRDDLLDDIVAGAAGARRVVLDLSGVEYLDSAGVRLVFEASRELARLGIDLALVQPRAPYVARILSLAAVGDMVPVYRSASDAFDAE